MDIRQYRYYKGAWIFLEEDKEKLLTKKESGDLLKKGGLFVRNIYEFDCKEKTSFWFIIKDEIEDISELPFSARRNIRRALKFYNIRKINLKEFSEIGFPIITSAQKSYKIKCHVINKNEFDEIIKKYENENDKEFWIVEKKENKEAVAIAINRIKENSCEYDDMKCKPEALKDRTYPYYGLIYTMNKYYLEEKKFKYVSDGSRSVTKHSNIQEFLEHNFRFRKAYCKFKIFYKTWFSVVINVLFPFRNIIPFRNVRAILKMEELSRNF
ncbi:MAG: hypothetical protein J6R17_01765 [Bacteroidales bacterium]|nr:hypothetical protein [Bacteroidales bacterium]